MYIYWFVWSLLDKESRLDKYAFENIVEADDKSSHDDASAQSMEEVIINVQ